MCTCRDRYEVHTDYHTIICTICGEETQGLFECRDICYESAGPMVMAYSRNRRFSNMLRAVLYPDGLYPKQRVIQELADNGPHTSAESILLSMRKMKFPNKQYQHLHLYCKLAQVNYVPPQTAPKEVFNKILRRFTAIEDRFNSTDHNTFFSYAWLLRHLLQEFHLDEYVRYVKRIQCNKRNKIYEELLVEIFKPQSKRRGELDMLSEIATAPLSRLGGALFYAYRHVLNTSCQQANPILRNERCCTEKKPDR